MTILIFNSGILTVASESWTATELTEGKRPLVQVHIFGSAALVQASLEMSLAEFLRIVAEGGKMVDLRGLQVPVLGHIRNLR